MWLMVEDMGWGFVHVVFCGPGCARAKVDSPACVAAVTLCMCGLLTYAGLCIAGIRMLQLHAFMLWAVHACSWAAVGM
jgi:hypothetical protein